MSLNRPYPYHSLLFAIYPILFLYSHNIHEVGFFDILQPIFIVIFLSFSLLFIFNYTFKSFGASGIITSIFIILFFSYGHLFNLIISMFKDVQQGHRWGTILALYFFYGIIFIFSIIFVKKEKIYLEKIINVFNTISLALVTFCLFNIILFKINETSRKNIIKSNSTNNTQIVTKNNLRDIYFIILDGHASSRTLSEYYNYEMDEFTKYLKNKGFFVADSSLCNYSISYLSLASSLNIDYLAGVGLLKSEVDSKSKSMRGPDLLIKKNRIVDFLKSKGYKFVHIGSGWGPTAQNKYADYDMKFSGGNEFSMIALQSTILMPIINYFFRFHIRGRVLFAFSELAKVHEIDHPKFVFAHIMSPHPPFVFGENGEKVFRTEISMDGPVWDQKKDYLNQLTFIDRKVELLFDEILANSKIPPIIVLQSDHGPGSPGDIKDFNDKAAIRSRILNAVYLPSNNDILYHSITPVNVFRLIFNTYFDTNYEILNDESYLTKNDYEPFSLTRVTEIAK